METTCTHSIHAPLQFFGSRSSEKEFGGYFSSLQHQDGSHQVEHQFLLTALLKYYFDCSIRAFHFLQCPALKVHVLQPLQVTEHIHR